MKTEVKAKIVLTFQTNIENTKEFIIEGIKSSIANCFELVDDFVCIDSIEIKEEAEIYQTENIQTIKDEILNDTKVINKLKSLRNRLRGTDLFKADVQELIDVFQKDLNAKRQKFNL